MKKGKNLLFLLLGLALGGGLGVVLAMHADTAPRLLLDFALLMLAAYAQLILHEAGHLLAGLLTGYRFVSFRIGSLMLLRQQGRFRLARFRLAGTGGQCLLAPPPMRDGDYPCVLYHLGGVLMNLLCALLAGAAMLAAGYSAWRLGTLAAGLVMAVTNGVPLRTSTVDNDGRNALRSLREKEVRLGFHRMLTVNAAISEGKRLRELPEEWMACAPGQERERGYTRFLWLLDQERYDEARSYGQTLQSADLVGVHRILLENDLRCLALLAGETPAAPSRELTQLTKAMGTHPPILRAQYIFALLQDKSPERANIFQKRFDKVLLTYPYPADAEADRALMRRAEQQFDGTSASRG